MHSVLALKLGVTETGYRPTDWSASVMGIVSGALFLRISGIRPNLLATHERLCVDHVRNI
jgi:hypothetical protein